MNWTNDKSIKISKVCICIFFIIALIIDIFSYKLVPMFAAMRHLESCIPYFYISIYLGSIAAYYILWILNKLLCNIENNIVYEEVNVKLLRSLSHSLIIACIICLISSIYYFPFGLIAIAAAFMMLIVRIVKNILKEAVDMKSDLDLTI